MKHFQTVHKGTPFYSCPDQTCFFQSDNNSEFRIHTIGVHHTDRQKLTNVMAFMGYYKEELDVQMPGDTPVPETLPNLSDVMI